MPTLTGFVMFPAVPGLTVEFWDREEILLVSHAIPPHTMPGEVYQYYFSQDYYVRRVEYLSVLFSDQPNRTVEVIARFGDRNPMRVW